MKPNNICHIKWLLLLVAIYTSQIHCEKNNPGSTISTESEWSKPEKSLSALNNDWIPVPGKCTTCRANRDLGSQTASSHDHIGKVLSPPGIQQQFPSPSPSPSAAPSPVNNKQPRILPFGPSQAPPFNRPADKAPHQTRSTKSFAPDVAGSQKQQFYHPFDPNQPFASKQPFSIPPPPQQQLFQQNLRFQQAGEPYQFTLPLKGSESTTPRVSGPPKIRFPSENEVPRANPNNKVPQLPASQSNEEIQLLYVPVEALQRGMRKSPKDLFTQNQFQQTAQPQPNFPAPQPQFAFQYPQAPQQLAAQIPQMPNYFQNFPQPTNFIQYTPPNNVQQPQRVEPPYNNLTKGLIQPYFTISGAFNPNANPNLQPQAIPSKQPELQYYNLIQPQSVFNPQFKGPEQIFKTAPAFPQQRPILQNQPPVGQFVPNINDVYTPTTQEIPRSSPFNNQNNNFNYQFVTANPLASASQNQHHFVNNVPPPAFKQNFAQPQIPSNNIPPALSPVPQQGVEEQPSNYPAPHQPPLSFYMEKLHNPKINDVLYLLKDSKTIPVLDTVETEPPQVFVGPSELPPPKGYVKFELPYLSSLDYNRIEKMVDRLPFFVAPLNFKPPPGYSKIPFPAPHIGSVVLSNTTTLQETLNDKPIIDKKLNPSTVRPFSASPEFSTNIPQDIPQFSTLISHPSTQDEFTSFRTSVSPSVTTNNFLPSQSDDVTIRPVSKVSHRPSPQYSTFQSSLAYQPSTTFSSPVTNPPPTPTAPTITTVTAENIEPPKRQHNRQRKPIHRGFPSTETAPTTEVTQRYQPVETTRNQDSFIDFGKFSSNVPNENENTHPSNSPTPENFADFSKLNSNTPNENTNTAVSSNSPTPETTFQASTATSEPASSQNNFDYSNFITKFQPSVEIQHNGFEPHFSKPETKVNNQQQQPVLETTQFQANTEPQPHHNSFETQFNKLESQLNQREPTQENIFHSQPNNAFNNVDFSPQSGTSSQISNDNQFISSPTVSDETRPDPTPNQITFNEPQQTASPTPNFNFNFNHVKSLSQFSPITNEPQTTPTESTSEARPQTNEFDFWNQNQFYKANPSTIDYFASTSNNNQPNQGSSTTETIPSTNDPTTTTTEPTYISEAQSFDSHRESTSSAEYTEAPTPPSSSVRTRQKQRPHHTRYYQNRHTTEKEVVLEPVTTRYYQSRQTTEKEVTPEAVTRTYQFRQSTETETSPETVTTPRTTIDYNSESSSSAAPSDAATSPTDSVERTTKLRRRRPIRPQHPSIITPSPSEAPTTSSLRGFRTRATRYPNSLHGERLRTRRPVYTTSESTESQSPEYVPPSASGTNDISYNENQPRMKPQEVNSDVGSSISQWNSVDNGAASETTTPLPENAYIKTSDSVPENSFTSLQEQPYNNDFTNQQPASTTQSNQIVQENSIENKTEPVFEKKEEVKYSFRRPLKTTTQPDDNTNVTPSSPEVRHFRRPVKTTPREEISFTPSSTTETSQSTGEVSQSQFFENQHISGEKFATHEPADERKKAVDPQDEKKTTGRRRVTFIRKIRKRPQDVLETAESQNLGRLSENTYQNSNSKVYSKGEEQDAVVKPKSSTVDYSEEPKSTSSTTPEVISEKHEEGIDDSSITTTPISTTVETTTAANDTNNDKEHEEYATLQNNFAQMLSDFLNSKDQPTSKNLNLNNVDKKNASSDNNISYVLGLGNLEESSPPADNSSTGAGAKTEVPVHDEDAITITNNPVQEAEVEHSTTTEQFIDLNGGMSANSKILATSTTTEISLETEICYRGKCVKTKKTKTSDLLPVE